MQIKLKLLMKNTSEKKKSEKVVKEKMASHFKDLFKRHKSAGDKSHKYSSNRNLV